MAETWCPSCRAGTCGAHREHKIEAMETGEGYAICRVCERSIDLVKIEHGPLIAGLGPDGPDLRRAVQTFWRHA